MPINPKLYYQPRGDPQIGPQTDNGGLQGVSTTQWCVKSLTNPESTPQGSAQRQARGDPQIGPQTDNGGLQGVSAQWCVESLTDPARTRAAHNASRAATPQLCPQTDNGGLQGG